MLIASKRALGWTLIRFALWYLIILFTDVMLGPYEGWPTFIDIALAAGGMMVLLDDWNRGNHYRGSSPLS